MNSLHKRWLNVLVTGLTVFSLVFNLALPLASLVSTVRAQEATEEPTPEETPADAPPPPTVEATGEPTAAPTAQVTPIVTEQPTAVPTLPTSFSDDFQDGNPDGWLLTPGWGMVNDNGNLFLTTGEPEQVATISAFVVSDFALSARLRVESGKTASVAVRSGAENYTVSLDSSGSVALYRGAGLLAQGAAQPPLPEGVPVLWHTLNLQVYAGLIVVTVNGAPQIVYTDPNPLPPGLVVFGTATGGLSLDEVSVSALTAPITPPVIPPTAIPTLEVTAEPTAPPETTPELTPEVTPEQTPEATVAPEVTPEQTPEATLPPEVTPEQTPEATPEPEILLLGADFEGELTGWTLTGEGSIVADGDANHALQLAAGSSLLPTNPPYLTDFRLEARLTLLEAVDGAPSGISIPFRTSDGSGYVLAIEAAQTVLYRNDGVGLVPLASIPAAHAPNTWHALNLVVQGGHLTASLNGTAELDFTDAAPLPGGQLAFAATGAALLDDIAVYVPTALLEAVTPAPMALTEDEKAKLAPVLVKVVELYAAGDEAGAVQQANETFLPLDEQMRLTVEVWAAEGQTGATVAPIVAAVGGEVTFVSDYHVEALVPLAGFIALVNADPIIQIRPAAQAASTGSADAPPAAPSGTAVTEGFDILGVNDWHVANIKGAGTSIAVIDTGFAGISSVPAAELPTTCLPSRVPVGGVGTTNHGTRVAEVLCDLAPNARMTLYRATTASELATRISAANSAGFPIILITMDVGVVASPGDGDEGLDASGTMYDQITAAKNAGRLVIVSAGNNTGRFASFNYAIGTTTVSLSVSRGDRVNVSWDDWNTVAPTKDLTMSLQHAAAYTPRLPTQAPAHQFVIDNTCGTTSDPTCTADLTISAVANGPAYVQVQVTGNGKVNSVTGSATNINTTSTIGRPADSPNAFTVGAVCSYPVDGFPLEADSSRGPIFSAGGGAPLTGPFTSRTAFKPDIASVAGVTTSQGARFDCNPGDPAEDTGFTGTSAAAAHIAGLAALIRSNPNANIGANTRDEIINYLQSHAVDLYDAQSEEANGFDMRTGAGLAVLGNPQPDYPIINSVTSEAGLSCGTGTLRFVDPNKLTATFDGTYGNSLANPYLHPAHALARANAGDCVILMPGEYVTPVNILDGAVTDGVRMISYDRARQIFQNQNRAIDQSTTPDSIFWVNITGYDDGARGGGGIFITADNITVDGFVFRTASRHTTAPLFNTLAGISLGDSSGSIVRNNLFTKIVGGNPVIVGGYQGIGSQSVVVENNIFRDNNSRLGAGVNITDGSGTSTPITLQFNSFIANNSTEAPGAGIYEPVVNINNSVANIYNNRFLNNGTLSIILVRNDDSRQVSVFGNAFSNNTNTGPVVHLNPGRRFRFINNTVAGHKSIGAGDTSAIILRGQPDSSPTNGSGNWDIFNNLFYDNTVNSPLADADVGSAQCHRIGSSSGPELGAQFNWIFMSGNPTIVGQNAYGGICVNPIEAGNGNRLELSAAPAAFRVIGPTIAPNDPYQIVGAATSSPDDGVDDGSNALASGLPDRDVLNRNRIENGTIDIGAYEYRAISAADISTTAVEEDRVLTTPPADAGKPAPIIVSLVGEGGFPPYTYTISDYPTMYDTNPANACGGQPLKLTVDPATNETQATYCPPKNLYTVGAPAGSQVTFTYHVQDLAGNTTATNDSPGTVTVLITPTNDSQLTQPINQAVTVEAAPPTEPATIIRFKLRPYVSFDDNFFYSEDGEIEDDLGPNGTPLWTDTPGADYPYTYALVPGSLNPPNAGALNISEAAIQAAINNANNDDDSLVELLAESGEKGTFSFRYTVNESTATTNTVEVEVVSSLPYGGLHDDTSFAFTYDTNWSPLYSEGNINNTLHRSVKSGATASFKFVGTGFALYMQGATTGSFWELRVDDQPLNWNGSKVATRAGITCRTTAATGIKTTTTPNNGFYISNRQATAYTVACTRLRQGEAHTVEIISRANAILNIDAIGVLVDNTVLLPGFHEVRETQMLPLFFGWNEITDRGTSNGIAMATTNAGVADVTFTFRGTGFAIGTALEQTRTLPRQGAKYTICVAPADTGTPQRCQQFDNALGAGTAPIWNVYRPFYGFNPDIEHEVTLHIDSLPATGRMVIDSIVVFDRQIAGVLPLGTTEDTDRDRILFGGGLEDTWLLDTNNTRTSGNSLTSIISTVTKAGPFFSFQIPNDATSFSWWRYATTTDSTSIMVCVDRGQLHPADTQNTFCVTKPLRTTTAPLVTHNPLVIAESDFGPQGWGTPGSNGAHTVEIFSLTNQPFNLDRVQVLSSSAPLQASIYEQNVPNLCYFDDDQPGFPCNDGTAPDSSVTTVNNTRASGGSVAFIKEQNEGVFFRFEGTGFSTLFTLDNRGGPVQLCWLKDVAQTATVDNVLTNGTCSQFNNYSATAVYQAARTVAGLEDSTYAAVIQHIGANYTVTGTVISGNSMQVDAIRVYGDRWQDLNELTPLPNGARHETSFANRAASNQLNYLGSLWRSFTGTAASRYSGQNYDQVKAYGAGIVFRTNGADTVRLYRDLRSGYAPLRLCYAPYTAGTFVVDYNLFTCVDIRSDGGTAYQSAYNVNLGSTGPHVVSITTLNAGTFNLDAIELLDAAPLQPGLYTETTEGLIYNATTDPNLNDTVNDWRNITSSSYANGAAMQSTVPGASLTFEFEGTGFSLLTLVDSASSNLQIVVNEIPDPPDASYTVDVTGNRSVTYYGHAHSVTGLPYDTYKVTITETDGTRNKFTVDGIEIYGQYSPALSPGIYDDNAHAADGKPLFLYGPSNAAWTVNLGSRAPANLNQSNHTSNRLGATLSFAVTGANVVVLHHIGSTSTNVQFCATLAASPFTRTCSPTTVTLVGSSNTTFTLGAVGNYQVSITNLTPGTTLIVDAIGVLNTTGALLPGIHQENSGQLTYGGNWASGFLTEASATDRRVKSTALGSSGQTLSFTFNGTGFSIVLAESTLTSRNYSLTVEGAPVSLPTPNANTAISSARAPSALTYVGFAPGEYDVVLTNLDPTKPLLVDRVDVLGDVSDIAASVTGGVENIDPRIVYFPYFSFNEVAAAAASGGSQHIGSMRGAAVYFELNTSAFEYGRELKSTYGSVAVCAGAFSADGSKNCGTTPNANPATISNVGAGFQQTQSVTLTGSGLRWVLLRNADGKPMPLDFVRSTNAGAALTAGYYEDSFGSLEYTGTFTTPTVTSASGGSVHQTQTAGDHVLFDFNGTGFSVYFVFDAKADAVEICWASGLGLNLAQTQAGDCTTYDNQSAAARYRAARTILGLQDGDYTASVQMLADNNTPAPHLPTATPITMHVDAIQIYDDAQPANRLDTVGTRYETSYANRAADGRFLYYGQGWRSVSGTAAARYSGKNYDTIANVIGAGLLFRTFNADSIIIYRNVGAGNAPMEVCSQRVDNGNRSCVTVLNNTGTGTQPTIAVPLVDAGYTGERRVSITTLDAGTLTLDAIEIGSSAAPLQPGLYEDVHPGLKFQNGTVNPPEVAWTSIFSASYSGGQARWTSDDTATMEFSFVSATGFEVGALADLYGGEMEICYDTDGDADWADATSRCYIYQNERSTASYTTSRTVTGLNPATPYFVRVRNAETNVPPRNPRYAPVRLVIDFVRIFGEALPPAITTSGQFNEDAASGGVKVLQLLPANRWNTFSGTAARGFSGGSYVGVVDNSKRLSSAYAGPVATLRLNNASAATVILYTGPASSLNSGEVLVCANNVTTADCIRITNLKTENQIVLNSTNLPVLANAANVTLSFRTLTTGQFRIDGFQVIFGTTLTPGIYDSFLVGNNGLLNTGGSSWTTVKSTRAYGGTLVRTKTANAAIALEFSGTGFSVLTQADAYGSDMRLCYVLKTAFDGTFDGTGETCQTVTTDTSAGSGEPTWLAVNGDRPNPITAYQYAFAIHGLPNGVYVAELRHIDTPPAGVPLTDWLQVDAVVVFGAPGAALASGPLHDDTNPNIAYSPSAFWTLLSTPYGPARGPWQRTEHNTTAVGTIAQVEVDGNALVLYQTGSTRASRKIRLCVTTDEGQDCTDFSQSTRTTYFTPVAFYGFGKADTHQIVIENWDYGKVLSVDALQVLP
ncbi:MAG: S8 family serine peptidase [Chloroflexi bacterium]|nr:S8 family serine peptidase [Chloroflexota bacterium]